MSLVGAIFDDRAAAASAASALRAIGVADDATVTAAWSGDRYVVDAHAGRDLGRSLAVGAALGAIVGVVVGAGIAVGLWQSVPAATAAITGGGVGALLMAVLGGYLGMNRRRRKLWDQRDWTHLDLSTGEVLVLVDAAGRTADEARARLRQNGGRIVEPTHPSSGV